MKKRTTSAAGLKMIKEFEDFRSRAYPDGNSYSVGYGHNGVSANATITKAAAEALLMEDLKSVYEPAVNSLGVELSQSQFDALVSLAYNAGPGAVKGNMATLLRESTAPRPALKEWWTGHYITSQGRRLSVLVARRAKEYEFYCQDNQKKKILTTTFLLLSALLFIIVYLNNNNK